MLSVEARIWRPTKIISCFVPSETLMRSVRQTFDFSSLGGRGIRRSKDVSSPLLPPPPSFRTHLNSINMLAKKKKKKKREEAEKQLFIIEIMRKNLVEMQIYAQHATLIMSAKCCMNIESQIIVLWLLCMHYIRHRFNYARTDMVIRYMGTYVCAETTTTTANGALSKCVQNWSKNN